MDMDNSPFVLIFQLSSFYLLPLPAKDIRDEILRMSVNSLIKIRESLLISKAELARKANVSPITISRIENGMPCRMETKRKILLALDLDIADYKKIFSD
jgi:DNA-binding XRE family transcriptional regulator